MERTLLLAALGLLAGCFRISDDAVDALYDQDGDGVVDAAYGGTDCDPTNNAVHPGAPEVCNGIDDDCNGQVDEGDAAPLTFYADTDEDGYGDAGSPVSACALPPGAAENALDCDDTDGAVHPDLTDPCDDVDNDCDGDTDEDATFSDWHADLDGDEYGDPQDPVNACAPPDGYIADDSDCDDLDAEVNPSADEVCDGVDNNCDDDIDEDAALDAIPWYTDHDQDGYGDVEATGTSPSCEPPDEERFSDNATDCDDDDANVHPGAEERCDGVDNDCDGSVDFELNVPTDHTYIQNAIDAATAGDRICVLAGAYREQLILEKDVSIIGEDRDTTVLLAQSDARVLHAVGVAGGARLENLTLFGGSATSGGALWLEDSSMHVEDVLITNGDVVSDGLCLGVGMLVEGPAAPTLSRVDFVSNGAICESVWGVLMVMDTTSPVVIDHLSVLDSTVYADSVATGVVSAYTGTRVELTNGIIGGNDVLYGGNVDLTSGMEIRGTALSATNATVELTNVVVHRNAADAGHGTVYSSGVYLDVSSQGVLNNTSISSNTASAPLVLATAIYGPYSMSYSNVYDQETPAWTGTNPIGSDGNIAENPLFINGSGSTGTSWDLRLNSASLLVNAGDPALQDPDGSTSDIGAYGGPGGSDW